MSSIAHSRKGNRISSTDPGWTEIADINESSPADGATQTWRELSPGAVKVEVQVAGNAAYWFKFISSADAPSTALAKADADGYVLQNPGMVPHTISEYTSKAHVGSDTAGAKIWFQIGGDTAAVAILSEVV